MHYWLVKTEPSTYSFHDLVRDKKTHWDGVRNFQARNNLRAMKKGDQVLIYHSVTEKAVVGTAEVVREAYPDPSAEKGDWVMVDIAPGHGFPHPVTLEMVKADPELADISLVRQGRLSVMPLTAKVYRHIEALGKGKK
jgi:predicted RNA-binding protein with PUA-like domain